MTIMVPRNENILQHMLRTAVEGAGPVALRYPRGKGVGVALDSKLERIEPGRGEVLRQGSEVLLVGVGPILYEALEAAEELAKEGISAAVIDARFVKPLDHGLIQTWARRCGRVVTLEENVLAGGFGSAVLESLSGAGLALPVKRIGLPDEFVTHGSQEILRAAHGLDAVGIKTTVETWMGSVEPKLKQAKIR